MQLPLFSALNSCATHHERASPLSHAYWQSDARAARGGSYEAYRPSISVQCSRRQLDEGVLVLVAAVTRSGLASTEGCGGDDGGCGGEGGSATQRWQLARHARRTRPLASHCAGLTCAQSTEGKPSPAQSTAPSSAQGGGCGGGGGDGGAGGLDGGDGGDGGGGGGEGGVGGGGRGERLHRPQLRRQARRTSALAPHCTSVAPLHRWAGNSSEPSQSVAPSSIHGGEGGGGAGGGEGGGEGEGVGLQVKSLQLPCASKLNSCASHQPTLLHMNSQSDARAARGGSYEAYQLSISVQCSRRQLPVSPAAAAAAAAVAAAQRLSLSLSLSLARLSRLPMVATPLAKSLAFQAGAVLSSPSASSSAVSPSDPATSAASSCPGGEGTGEGSGEGSGEGTGEGDGKDEGASADGQDESRQRPLSSVLNSCAAHLVRGRLGVRASVSVTSQGEG